MPDLKYQLLVASLLVYFYCECKDMVKSPIVSRFTPRMTRSRFILRTEVRTELLLEECFKLVFFSHSSGKFIYASVT